MRTLGFSLSFAALLVLSACSNSPAGSTGSDASAAGLAGHPGHQAPDHGGASGAAGLAGAAGQAGLPWAVGNAGSAGNAGIAGNAGSAGLAGQAGNAGTASHGGQAGNAGLAGKAGNAGLAGAGGGEGGAAGGEDGCEPGEPVDCVNGTTRRICGPDGQPGSPVACPAASPYCGVHGACVECQTASQCPGPAQECLAPACAGGVCGAAPAAAGTPVAQQTAQDCSRRVCDGAGGLAVVADPDDAPQAQEGSCLVPVCDGTKVAFGGAPIGKPCNGGLGVCNGAGACGECIPSEIRCQGSGTQVCSPSGHWNNPEPCPESTPVCSAGACASVLQVAGNGDSLTAAQHTCAVLSDRTLRCWGANESGQLGLGGLSLPKTRPQIVPGLDGVLAVAVGGRHTCASNSKGLWCWGSNDQGQLGTTVYSDTTRPNYIFGPVSSVAAGSRHTCAVSGAQVYCWGDNAHQQSGPAVIGGTVPVPVEVTGSEGAIEVVVGDEYSCALGPFEPGLPGNQVRCWGENSSGQLGTDGAPGGEPRAVVSPDFPSQKLTGVLALAAGPTHACALVEGSKAYCWGEGKGGSFGDEGSGKALHASKKLALGGAHGLTAGLGLTCEIKDLSSQIVCTGANASGQLGNGGFAPGTGTPTLLPLAGVDAVRAGRGQVCAIAQGALSCWGQNDSGQAGVGTLDKVASPTLVQW